MKQTSKVLFLVGGILAILCIIVFALCAVACFVTGVLAVSIVQGANPGQEIIDIFNKMVAETGKSLKELAVMFIYTGVVISIMFVFSIASAVLSFIDKARPNPGLGLLIPPVVIHTLGGNVVSLAGGIVAIVYWATKGRKEE